MPETNRFKMILVGNASLMSDLKLGLDIDSIVSSENQQGGVNSTTLI
jgi:hypothetical protein